MALSSYSWSSTSVISQRSRPSPRSGSPFSAPAACAVSRARCASAALLATLRHAPPYASKAPLRCSLCWLLLQGGLSCADFNDDLPFALLGVLACCETDEQRALINKLIDSAIVLSCTYRLMVASELAEPLR